MSSTLRSTYSTLIGIERQIQQWLLEEEDSKHRSTPLSDYEHNKWIQFKELLSYVETFRQQLPNLREGEENRRLGVIQGSLWQLGFLSLTDIQETHFHFIPRFDEVKVDDLVQLISDKDKIWYRVGKTSIVDLGKGSAYLLHLDGTDHGWEDLKMLR